MENSLSYTFSTIAQSLAGVLSLLGAFALFRIQSINQELRQYSAVALKPFFGHGELHDLLVTEEYTKFLVLFDKKIIENEGCVSFREDEQSSINRLRSLVPVRKDIISSLKLAFIVTTITMVASCSVLSAVTLLAGDFHASRIVLVLGVILFGLCLVLLMHLVTRFTK